MIISEARIRLNPDKAYVGEALRSINQNFAPRTILVPLSNGEKFFANGHVQRIQRGEVDARFIPKRGTFNSTQSAPASPIRPGQSMKVPRGVGVVVFFDYIKFLATLKETQAFLQMVQRLSDANKILVAEQDIGFMEDTLTAVQVEPQAMAQRLRAQAMTKTARRTGIKTTRIRGWSRL